MAKVVYTGVSSKARKCKALYVGVNNKARKIKKGYVGVSNKARLFYNNAILYTWYKYNVTTGYRFNITSSSDRITAGSANAGYYAELVINSGSTFDKSIVYTISRYFYQRYSDDFSQFSTSCIYMVAQVPSNGWIIGFGTELQASYAARSDGKYIFLPSDISRQSMSGSQYIGYVFATHDIKGSYVGTVTSYNQNAYPTDGVSGSYWYVRV